MLQYAIKRQVSSGHERIKVKVILRAYMEPLENIKYLQNLWQKGIEITSLVPEFSAIVRNLLPSDAVQVGR